MEGALIGEKLGHSFSKEIHNYLGVDYSLIEMNLSQLKDFVDNTKLNFFNVTIPFKKSIIPFLDDLDISSKKIGAVNTVIVKKNKKYGFNTDYYGFKALLEKNKIDVKDKNVLILGTGGTKETVSAVMHDLGAKSIRIVSRNGEINYNNCYFSDVNIIVNTTPIGMYPNLEMVNIDLSKFDNLIAVVDCIYNPLNTSLVLKAKSLGLKACGGLYMLVAQAVYAHKILNENLDLEIIDKIYKEIYLKKINIALIGMPSCGKSTIGKLLSEKTGKNFIDTDNLIFEKYGNIEKIFSTLGEQVFREYETEVVQNVSKNNNQIIATGGGVILNEKNIQNLKHNSIIIYIKRNLELLETKGRPLSKNLETLTKMFEKREPMYRLCADFIMENNGSIVDIVFQIIKELNL